MMELGPFGVNPDGKSLYARKYAWNRGILKIHISNKHAFTGLSKKKKEENVCLYFNQLIFNNCNILKHDLLMMQLQIHCFWSHQQVLVSLIPTPVPTMSSRGTEGQLKILIPFYSIGSRNSPITKIVIYTLWEKAMRVAKFFHHGLIVYSYISS